MIEAEAEIHKKGNRMRNAVLLALCMTVLVACSQLLDSQDSLWTTESQEYRMTSENSSAEFDEDLTEARTIDGQEILVGSIIRFHIEVDYMETVRNTWSEVNGSYRDGLIRPTTRSIIRDVMSTHRASDMFNDTDGIRETIRQEIETRLDQELDSEGFAVDEFLILEIIFSDDYNG